MRPRRGFLPHLLSLAGLALLGARADTGDIVGAHDYPGFNRLPGFVITDFDEDNPADFDFMVARPLPIDSGHLEAVHVTGHRFAIRYEVGSEGRGSGIFDTQRYYEKLASDAGYTIEKTGAEGDVSETFHKATANHEIWVCLEPATSVNVLTVVESSSLVMLPPGHAPSANPASPSPGIVRSIVAPSTTVATATAPPVVPGPSPDTLYDSLMRDGRVVLPIGFLPGKDGVEASSRPLVDAIAAMLKNHPEVYLRVEGHTDNSGDPEENLRLSAMRAFTIRDLLVEARIDQARLDAVGVGGLQPMADNSTAEGREKNRRIELVLRRHHPPPAATTTVSVPNSGG